MMTELIVLGVILILIPFINFSKKIKDFALIVLGILVILKAFNIF